MVRVDTDVSSRANSTFVGHQQVTRPFSLFSPSDQTVLAFFRRPAYPYAHVPRVAAKGAGVAGGRGIRRGSGAHLRPVCVVREPQETQELLRLLETMILFPKSSETRFTYVLGLDIAEALQIETRVCLF